MDDDTTITPSEGTLTDTNKFPSLMPEGNDDGRSSTLRVQVLEIPRILPTSVAPNFITAFVGGECEWWWI